MEAKLSTYVFLYSPPTTPPLHKSQSFTSLNCYSFYLFVGSVFTCTYRILLSLIASRSSSLTLHFRKKTRFIPVTPIGNPALRPCYSAPSVENSKLKFEMKRGFSNSHQCYGSRDDGKVKHKYHCLLEDFLELQKVFVSKKKKLQTQELKREILVEEVRFLRQRHNYLTKSQLSKVESQLSVNQNADIPDVPMRRDLNYINNKERTGREVLAWMKPCIKKKPNNCLTNDNKNRPFVSSCLYL